MEKLVSDFEENKNVPHFFNIRSFMKCLDTEFLGRYFQYRLETTSTMEDIKNEIKKGSFSGTTVLAESQTRGRGQNRGDKPNEVREWSSLLTGNLYFSFLLKTNVRNANKVILSLPVSIVKGLEKVGIEAKIKWPNDVLVNEKKICGTLILSELCGSSFSMNIGVGMNVYEDMKKNEAVEDIAISVANALVEKHSKSNESYRPPEMLREEILSTLFNTLEICLVGNTESVIRYYRRYSYFSKGDVVTVMPQKKENASVYYKAKYVDLDESGYLVVQKEDGSVLKLKTGEVSVRKTD